MRWIGVAFTLRRRIQALVGWRTRGVKVAGFDAAGNVLLVRHRYGDTKAFLLPGGRVKRHEATLDAAIRESREEVGCDLAHIVSIGTYLVSGEGRRDTVHLFVGTPVADAVEIAEASFFALGSLPPSTSPATRRRLDEIAGRRPVDAAW
jgi:8-oxo-dGTP pyrophosphatase MutT (NUDIX family)